MVTTFHKSKNIIFDALTHFNSDDGWAIASHVALTAIMALFPFLIFMAALASFVGSQELAEQAALLLFDNWPEEISTPLIQEITIVLTQPRGDLLTIGIGLALILASNGVEGVRIALNRSYRQNESRSFLFRRLQSILFVIIGALALLAITFLIILAPLGWKIAQNTLPFLIPFSKIFLFGRIFIATFILIVALFVAHKWLPYGRRSIREIWPGIIFTLLIWILAAFSFSLYLQSFNAYASTYAGLASAMIALVFFYILAVIFILGGEINASIMRHKT